MFVVLSFVCARNEFERLEMGCWLVLYDESVSHREFRIVNHR